MNVKKMMSNDMIGGDKMRWGNMRNPDEMEKKKTGAGEKD
jgi:hypothetical protein